MPHNVASDLGLHCLPMICYEFPGKNGLRLPHSGKACLFIQGRNIGSQKSCFPLYKWQKKLGIPTHLQTRGCFKKKQIKVTHVTVKKKNKKKMTIEQTLGSSRQLNLCTTNCSLFSFLFYFVCFPFNPSYTGEILHCYMLDESICH